MQAQASAADVDLIDRMLINRRLRRIRTNLRPHAKLESVHHLQSNVPDDFDELDIMRPRPSPRHYAKAKLESPLEEDLHGPSTSGDLQGVIIASNSSSTSAGQAGSHVGRTTMSVTSLMDIERKNKHPAERHFIANVHIE